MWPCLTALLSIYTITAWKTVRLWLNLLLQLLQTPLQHPCEVYGRVKGRLFIFSQLFLLLLSDSCACQHDYLEEAPSIPLWSSHAHLNSRAGMGFYTPTPPGTVCTSLGLLLLWCERQIAAVIVDRGGVVTVSEALELVSISLIFLTQWCGIWSMHFCHAVIVFSMCQL